MVSWHTCLFPRGCVTAVLESSRLDTVAPVLRASCLATKKNPSVLKPYIRSYLLAGFLLTAVFLLGISSAWAATIHAELDRHLVSLNESFTLVFETEGSADDEPDFAPLEQDFEILRQNQGSRMQIINSQISQSEQWTLTLMGKKAGVFEIPSISFGSDRSPALQIKIESPSANPKSNRREPLFLEVFASPTSAYVQSQIIYTIRLYRSVNLLSANISSPELSDADAVVEQLGEDREYETSIQGKRYIVSEHQYAIFPQQSGHLTIAPISFAGQLASQSRSRFNPFPGGGAIKRLRSESIELEIKPVPQDKVHGRWLPAEDLQLKETWSEAPEGTDRYELGTPATWTLTLIAKGLTAAQLPEIKPALPKGLKSYPDKPILNNDKRSDGIIGIRQEKIALIPTRPGTYLLPAIEIPWWNTEKQQVEIARLPERRIEVAPSEAAQPPLPAPSFQPETGQAPTFNSASRTGQGNSGFWSWVSLVLALGWVVTLIAWWGSRQPPGKGAEATASENPESEDVGPIKRQLKKACLKNEAEAAKEALLSWGRAMKPGHLLSLGELGKHTGLALEAEMKELNSVLYSQNSEVWQEGSTLWSAFEQEMAGMKKSRARKTEGLAPLVPMG